MRRLLYCVLCFGAACAAPDTGMAGGGPQNALVIVNQNSEASMALGNYYRETRGIPPFNVFAVDVDITNNMDTVTFSNQVRNPILAYISDAGLSNQIEYIVFSKDIPYRIYDGPFTNMRFSSTTSSMFYGFKSSPDAFVSGCQLAAGSEHDYYEAERSFRRAVEGDHALYPSTYLTSLTPDGTRHMMDRSAAVDHLQPTGHVYFAFARDIFRNVRWTQYENAQFLMRFLDVPITTFFEEDPPPSLITNAMGYITGTATVSGINNFDLQPGALADHLTSYGGNLFDTNQGKMDPNQMSILQWIDGGAAGSYGTLVEPCAYSQKFPQARLHHWYARGFNLAESFYMSVRNPYQGIVVGDPLTQPYSRPPTAELSGIAAYEVISGVVTVQVTGASAHTLQHVDQLDLYLNDRFQATPTNVTPRTGNTITATINGNNRIATILVGDDIYDAAQRVATAINGVPPLGVTATAVGDRIEIKQNAQGAAGTGITYSVTTQIGAASELTIFGSTPGTNFAESTASALRAVRLEGTATTGDVVRAVVTRLDSVVITNEVVAVAGSTPLSLMTNLMAVINSDPDLQVSDGVKMELFSRNPNASGFTPVEAVFISRTNSWQSYAPHLDFQVISSTLGTNEMGLLNDNSSVMTARGMIYLRAGRTNLTASYVIDTTGLPDGPHTLRAVAYDGSALRTQGHALLPFVVSNYSGASCSITLPEHGANIAAGTVITAMVDAAFSPGTVTSVQFYAHGRLIAETNAAPWEFAWDTGEQGAGMIELQARAFSDANEQVLSDISSVRVFMDTDGDGIPDWWEYMFFNGITNAMANADTDSDGTTNLEEYLADTDPNDDQSYFAISSVAQDIGGDLESITFSSGTTRLYRVHYLDENLTNSAAWTGAPPGIFRGNAPETTWAVTNAPATTNDFRFFRVGASVP